MNKEIMEWLMENDNLSVKAYVMENLMNESYEALNVARNNSLNDPVIQKILENQNSEGFWGNSERFYLDKYKGTVWQLIILANLGVDGNYLRIKKACEFILNNSQDLVTKGFSVESGKKISGGLPSKVIPCLTGNVVHALIKFGYFEDERVQGAIDWIVKYQRTDDGKRTISKEEAYSHHDACFGHHSCHMGVIKCLKALSVIPEEKRSKHVQNKINELVEFILVHHIHKKSHNLSEISKQGWTRFGFPLMYQTDILEILEILTDLRIYDKRMDEAIEVLIKKRKSDGRWILANSFNGKMLIDVEKKGQPSKWITAKALKVLGIIDEIRRNDDM